MNVTAQQQVTREHLLAACKIQKSTDVVDWTQVSEDMRWWIAGQIDGDGYIGAESSFLRRQNEPYFRVDSVGV